MQQLSRQSRIALREGIANYFSKEELEILCFDLGIIYENLPSQTRDGKVKDLILHYERTDSIEALVERCSALRPNAPWQSLVHLEVPSQVQVDLQNGASFAGRSGNAQVVCGNVAYVTINVTYLGQNLATELSDIAKFARPIITQVIESPKAIEPRIFEVPPLPVHFVGRRQEITLIKEVLINPSSSPKPVIISSISGRGGIGKTTLAIAVANDSEVKEAFPDGILWASFRSGANLHEKLTQWLSILLPTSDSNTLASLPIPGLLAAFKSATLHRRLLIILDGLNESEDVKLSSSVLNDLSEAIDKNSRILVTSRMVRIEGAERIFTLDLLTERDALQLFTERLGRQLSNEEQPLAREIVQLCGYHPLAISLAAPLVAVGNYELKTLRSRLACQYSETQDISIDSLRKSSIKIALERTVGILEPEARRKFRQLSVFGEDEFDLRAASVVWRTSETDAKLVIGQFLRLSLLQSKDDFYKMHPLVLEYAKTLFDEADWNERAETMLAYGRYSHSQK